MLETKLKKFKKTILVSRTNMWISIWFFVERTTYKCELLCCLHLNVIRVNDRVWLIGLSLIALSLLGIAYASVLPMTIKEKKHLEKNSYKGLTFRFHAIIYRWKAFF